MRLKSPVARASLVPVLGIAALVLFSLNFYRFLDLRFFSKVKHFICNEQAVDVEAAHPRHMVIMRHGTQNDERQFEIRVFNRQQGEAESQDLEWAQRDLERRIRSTEREIARTARRLRWERDRNGSQADVSVNLESLEQQLSELEQQLEGRTEDLESLSRELRIRASEDAEAPVVIHPSVDAEKSHVHMRVLR